MSERENIFARIREALTVKALKPVVGHGSAPAGPLPAVSAVLPAVGATLADHLAQFRQNAGELKADFEVLGFENELGARLGRLRDAEGWKRVAAHPGELTNAACRALGLPVLWCDGRQDKHELERCDVGLTECDALVAQTGSVVVTSRSAGGRALSVLPPHHVVLARRGQVVGGLPEAFALLKAKYGAGYPSMISFITGPSRTGDIERILVLGAHGPKRLTILCL